MEKAENINNFKLIGIRPHLDCGEKFLKVLEPGRLYQFYNEYEFFTKNGKFDGVNGEITRYEYKETVPEDLYKVGNLNVNISAIVGKNGTGKSTLIELLLYAIYIIGVNFKDSAKQKPMLPKYSDLLKLELKKAEDKLKSRKSNIESYESYISKDIKKISRSPVGIKYLESRIFGLIEEIKLLSNNINNLENKIRNLKIESVLSDENLNEFHCTFIYVLDNNIYELSFCDEINLSRISKYNKEKCDNIDLNENFFYSTILNYSHHALNSNHIGYWINSLFHKNDGYKTPAVINPMRQEGNFDINTEIELSKSRLLVNSLINQLNDLKKLVPVSDKQHIESIEIKRKHNSSHKNTISLKESNIYGKRISGNVVSVNTIEEILVTNGLKDFVEIGYYGDYANIVEDLLNYLVNKVHKIQRNYSEYFDPAISIDIPEADQIVDDRFTIKKLNTDFSHVSFKYHRSIFFLKKIVTGEFDAFLKKIEEKKTFSMNEYLLQIGFVDEKNEILEQDLFQIFLRVPPPIFEVDFNISKSDVLKEEFCKISDLSSGEQQNIHTINTFIYHLNNTFSVHKESSGTRQKYQYFNAVFDEIELYFHPDYQRRFISELIKTIQNQKHLIEGEFIKGINIIFSTHSPFILSDIPEHNIIKLEYDEDKKYSIPISENKKTFSANIYDLLANTFFMKDGYIGEFAKSKISEIIVYLNENYYNQDKHINYEKHVDIIGDKFIREKLQDMLKSKQKIQFND